MVSMLEYAKFAVSLMSTYMTLNVFFQHFLLNRLYVLSGNICQNISGVLSTNKQRFYIWAGGQEVMLKKDMIAVKLKMLYSFIFHQFNQPFKNSWLIKGPENIACNYTFLIIGLDNKSLVQECQCMYLILG